MMMMILIFRVARREDRIRAIKEAKERISACESERVERDKAKQDATLAKRRKFEKVNERRFESQANRASYQTESATHR